MEFEAYIGEKQYRGKWDFIVKNSEVKPGMRFKTPDGTECVIIAPVVPDQNPLRNKWWAAPIDNAKPSFMVCFDVDKPEPITMSQSFVWVEESGQNERMFVSYALNMESTRRQILLRRACAIIAGEECRLYGLTDAQAIEELDALKAKQDVQGITKYPVGSE